MALLNAFWGRRFIVWLSFLVKLISREISRVPGNEFQISRFPGNKKGRENKNTSIAQKVQPSFKNYELRTWKGNEIFLFVHYNSIFDKLLPSVILSLAFFISLEVENCRYSYLFNRWIYCILHMQLLKITQHSKFLCQMKCLLYDVRSVRN